MELKPNRTRKIVQFGHRWYMEHGIEKNAQKTKSFHNNNASIPLIFCFFFCLRPPPSPLCAYNSYDHITLTAMVFGLDFVAKAFVVHAVTKNPFDLDRRCDGFDDDHND